MHCCRNNDDRSVACATCTLAAMRSSLSHARPPARAKVFNKGSAKACPSRGTSNSMARSRMPSRAVNNWLLRVCGSGGARRQTQPQSHPPTHATYNNPKLSSAAPSCSFGDAWRIGSAPAPPPAPLGSVVGCGGGDTRRLTRLESPSSWWFGGGESTSEPPPPAGIMSTVSLLAGVSGVAEPRVRTLVSINAPPSPEAEAAE